MEDIKDAARYGFGLFPLAALTVLGLFFNNYGPTLFNGLLTGMQGSMLYQPAAILGTLLIQMIGGAVIFAGVFGALYRTLVDARED